MIAREVAASGSVPYLLCVLHAPKNIFQRTDWFGLVRPFHRGGSALGRLWYWEDRRTRGSAVGGGARQASLRGKKAGSGGSRLLRAELSSVQQAGRWQLLKFVSTFKFLNSRAGRERPD